MAFMLLNSDIVSINELFLKLQEKFEDIKGISEVINLRGADNAIAQ
jgi:hypothetical protein